MAKRVIWSDEARADMQAIDRDVALRLLKAIARYLKTGMGEVKQLQGFEPIRLRLRIGDWRVIFHKPGREAVEIIRVRHRARGVSVRQAIQLVQCFKSPPAISSTT
jgi:mRNA-degrading endonuclease RelE of RelBE toxin-antitoxin system